MRKLLILFAFAPLACTVATPVSRPPEPHGLTVEEEAQILGLEDRRELDPAVAAQWSQNPNPIHRARIALALARIGPHTFVDMNNNGERDADERQAGIAELTTLANDADANVRTTVAFALGEIGDATAIETLFKLANDSNATVAAEAAEALSKLAKDVPIARYAALTTSGPDGARGRAIRFLFRFNSDEASAAAANQLSADATAIRQEAAYALARRAYAPAREKLELQTSDTNILTRVYAVTALGRIGAAESMPALIRALGDINPWVRTNALVAVGRVAAKDRAVLNAAEVPRLLALTEDPDPGTRSSSIDTLGYYGTMNETAKKRLLDIAANGSRWERELAAGAIAKHFGDSDLAIIPADLTPWGKVRVIEASAELKKNGAALRRRYGKDPDVLVRENTIGNIPDEAVDDEIDLIRPALDDPDPIVRSNAIDRYIVSKKDSIDTRRQTLNSAEQRAHNDRENDARVSAIRGLSDIDHPDREPFFRSLLTDNDPIVRRLAADVIEEKLKKPRPQYTPLPVSHDYAEIVNWAREPHTATIHMTRGAIDIALLPQDAPITAWNFAQLAKKKYFDNTSFMRVVPNFVIQGGDPRNDQNGGPGYAIRDEINLQKYTRGAVGMALSGPDTGGSQFFITHSPQPHLDGGYTIFGRVTAGMNSVVDQTERGDRVETIAIDEHPR
ncbi:MAG TPA: HEAT repeat domain-containing protein [Thermoanaerobaculia bacterium]|jgi:cyclophilin family peptidyl-prolyl cis-trans isomerase/HEAT repeat protein|nr:HEAT repeat domain-containing protein [Thermoanaerobaculia bacterium]